MNKFLLLVGLVLFASCANSEDEKKALEEKHCNMTWEEMNDEEKEDALSEFIRESGSINNGAIDLGATVSKLIKASVQHPETVMVDEKELGTFLYLGPQTASISNVDQGLITYYKKFTAKNKLSQDVRLAMQLDLKYNAGCKGFELVDFKVE